MKKNTSKLVLTAMTRKQRTKPLGFNQKIEMPTELAIKWATKVQTFLQSIQPEINQDIQNHAQN